MATHSEKAQEAQIFEKDAAATEQGHNKQHVDLNSNPEAK